MYHPRAARRLESIPVLPYLLSGGLAEPPDNPTTSQECTTNTKGRRESLFELCLTRPERDAEVRHTAEAFTLNGDQARLLWRCAAWFRTTAAADNPQDGKDEKRGGEESGRQATDRNADGGALCGGTSAPSGARRDQQVNEKGGGNGPGSPAAVAVDAGPVVLVHGVFGEQKWRAVNRAFFCAQCGCYRVLRMGFGRAFVRFHCEGLGGVKSRETLAPYLDVCAVLRVCMFFCSPAVAVFLSC